MQLPYGGVVRNYCGKELAYVGEWVAKIGNAQRGFWTTREPHSEYWYFSPDGRAVGGSLRPGCVNITSCGSREASPALLQFLADLSRCAHDAITPHFRECVSSMSYEREQHVL